MRNKALIFFNKGLFSKSQKPISKDEVLLRTDGYLATMTLNRPEVLNCLNTQSFRLISSFCEDLHQRERARAVILKGDGEKAFCSGGDIKECYNYILSGNFHLAREFKTQEFRADHSLATLKPFLISILHGHVIGAAVGLTFFSKSKIATDTTAMSLPEARIGFCIDAGGSHYVHKIPNNVGKYMALTGKILTGKDTVKAKMATHFIPKNKLGHLEQTLLNEIVFDTKHDEIMEIIESFSIKVTERLEHIEEIDKYFSIENFDEFWESLQRNSSHKFVQECLSGMKNLSALAIRVIFEQFRRAKNLSLQNSYKFESLLAEKFLGSSEFTDSVNAFLIEKHNKPHRRYSDPSEIPKNVIEEYFDIDFFFTDNQELLK